MAGFQDLWLDVDLIGVDGGVFVGIVGGGPVVAGEGVEGLVEAGYGGAVKLGMGF